MTILELPADTQGVPARPKEEQDPVLVLVNGAVVQRVAGGGPQGSLVTLVVPAHRAAEIASLSAQNRVALVGSAG